MKILVAVKRVIDYNVQIRVKEDNSGVVTDNVKMSTNPPDDNAIEEAVKIKEAGKAKEIVAVTIGEEKAQETVRKALAVGADTLLQLIKNYSRCHKMKKAITVGVIGFPNVGKSSIINSLKRSRAVGVSSQPGYTKVMQEVQLDSKVKLLDSPGVIFQDDTIDNTGLLLRNCISVDALEDPIPAAEAIIGRCKPEQLMAQYFTTRFNSPGEFLYLLAQQQGKLKKGGIPDKERAARNLVQDWNTGKIPFYTLPPKEAPKQNAVILEQYSKEFNLDEVYPNQIKVLKELPEQDEDDFMAVSAPAPRQGRERGWSSDHMDEDD